MSPDHDPVKKAIRWIDQHPRLGWYLFLIGMIDVILDVLNLLQH